MTPSQQPLPGIRNWTDPQVVSCRELTPLIAEAARAGFAAITLEVLCDRPGGYRVTFVKKESLTMAGQSKET